MKLCDFGTSKSNFEVLRSNLWKIASFSGAISCNVLYYQQLSIACYQVSFCAKVILSNYQQCPLRHLKEEQLMDEESIYEPIKE